MLNMLHTKYGIGPHHWRPFGEEMLFDPEDPSVHTATKVRKRCACGKMLTTIHPTGYVAGHKTPALTQVL